MVGFSTDPAKAAHTAPMQLVLLGWNVVPIHPTATTVAGLQAYRSLAEVPDAIDLVNVFRPAVEAPEIARQAVAIGAGALWLQLGIVSDEARRIATEAGLDYVEDACAGAIAARGRLHPPA